LAALEPAAAAAAAAAAAGSAPPTANLSRGRKLRRCPVGVAAGQPRSDFWPAFCSLLVCFSCLLGRHFAPDCERANCWPS